MRPRHIAAEYTYDAMVEDLRRAASMRPRHIAAEYEIAAPPAARTPELQ